MKEGEADANCFQFTQSLKSAAQEGKYKNQLKKIPFNTKKNSMERAAPAGRVTTQEVKMVPTIFRSIAPIPRAMPTPKTAPTKV